MEKKNYAFIDSQNLNLGIKSLGWSVDMKKFRIFLKDKYKINKAFLFIGYIPEYNNFYKQLKSFGYTLIYKPTVKQKGLIKGNCDAELVMHCILEKDNFNHAMIISGDGDFHCLIEYLLDQKKLLKVAIPCKKRYSSLLKKIQYTKKTKSG